jgi:hypothetical protein
LFINCFLEDQQEVLAGQVKADITAVVGSVAVVLAVVPVAEDLEAGAAAAVVPQDDFKNSA